MWESRKAGPVLRSIEWVAARQGVGRRLGMTSDGGERTDTAACKRQRNEASAHDVEAVQRGTAALARAQWDGMV
jgi:hypothetical protein